MNWFNPYAQPGNTPAGNPIGPVEGNPVDISERGTQLSDLAALMSDSASLIQRLVDHGANMEGDAVDRLRETAGEVGGDLGIAAGLYAALGPALTRYATALETAQDELNPRAELLVELWAQYAARANDADDLQGGVGRRPDADADADDIAAYERRDSAAENAALSADNALGRWEEEARAYDRAWNTWHDAFLAAAGDVVEETTDRIGDTPEDEWRNFLAVASDVLMVAGMVLAVAAVIIGGPIVAAIALAVSVASLVVVICQMPHGDADGWDLAFAVIGVIPFGAMAEGFTALRGVGGAASNLSDGAGAFARTLFDVAPASGNSRLLGDFAGAIRGDGARWLSALRNPADVIMELNRTGPAVASAGDFVSRLFTGRDASLLEIARPLYSDLPDMAAFAFGTGGHAIQTVLTFGAPVLD